MNYNIKEINLMTDYVRLLNPYWAKMSYLDYEVDKAGSVMAEEVSLANYEKRVQEIARTYLEQGLTMEHIKEDLEERIKEEEKERDNKLAKFVDGYKDSSGLSNSTMIEITKKSSRERIEKIKALLIRLKPLTK